MVDFVMGVARPAAAILLFFLLAGGEGMAGAVVVDGYDLTAALSEMPLKEAYKEYFKIGVGLNGSSK